MRVLVIPEDFRNDHFILKPLFSRLFSRIGLPRARIQICRDPILGGVSEALKSKRLQEIMDQYSGMTDVFILCVDRDGQPNRRRRLDQLEHEFSNDPAFFAENAWEEIETWVLAGLRLPRDWRWKHVRSEVHVKETYFEPLAEMRGVADGPGGGRKALGEQGARQIPRIRAKCPEDFDALAGRIEGLR